MTLLAELSESRRELSLVSRELEVTAKALAEDQRKLKAREKDVVDMHNNHVKMRLSLTEIRELHLPVRPTYDPEEDVPCSECNKRWPCPTYKKINTPDHLVVSSLMEMQRDLSRGRDHD